MENYNSIIIGFGKGGKTLAGTLASKGFKVALIEKSEMMYGGTCINVGCIPSKSLILSGEIVSNQDIDFSKKETLYKKAIIKKRNLTSALREKNFKKLDDLNNVTIYNGEASFKSDTEIKIENNNETTVISGDRIFINTGSTPNIPSIKGIKNNPHVYTSDKLMDLDNLPKNLVVIGGGYIGLEFASMYSNFGSNVTVIQHSGVFLKKEDKDIADAIKENLKSQGVSFIFNCETESIVEKDNRTLLNLKINGKNKEIEADGVLIATGRLPNTSSLKCENAGVELTERGAIKVDSNLRTTAKNIWAMGDVVGKLQFTYTSLDDYRVILSQVYGDKSYDLTKRENIPFSVFLSPPYAKVGLSEKEAIKQGYNIKVGKLLTNNIPKAKVLGISTGLLKAIINVDNNKILGAALFTPDAHEVINIIKLVIDEGLEYTVLRDKIFTHPTMTESLNDLFNI